MQHTRILEIPHLQVPDVPQARRSSLKLAKQYRELHDTDPFGAARLLLDQRDQVAEGLAALRASEARAELTERRPQVDQADPNNYEVTDDEHADR